MKSNKFGTGFANIKEKQAYMYYENNAEKRVEKMRKLINEALTIARDAKEKGSKSYKDYDDTIKIFNEYTFW